ncbi:response regulator transcription factor [Priestia flexa]|jgi:DNA-binding response OmpR family regulator|uniref:Two-component system response regulator n=2 Tax=Priestia TaxID=2800373 RepID=A0A0V8JKL6_9BACI|nr:MULTISPECIES: response regulator transcription factor [Bacillaceae]AQX55126.1 DNA-binding response regulator [Priestia flexa]KSU87496.1 two-component system response regulator [Priestia veravalensis]KZB92309.1 DNA-binding response regulator [Bacillus sp. VT 712]MBN8251615.1 response regulator transcription factor [Priestia flexa]MBN8436079.1 response regulator transcription factor [Priestia flexa]
MNVLLAEDDLQLGELVSYMLKKKAGFNVEWVTEGRDAYFYAVDAHYDILILDWMMPNGDGVEICQQLRKEGYNGAILMLTAKDAVQDRVHGLDAGADDYMVKPFEIDELLARLRALSRRNYAPIVEETVKIDQITLNRSSQMMNSGDKSIQLSPREFQLLDFLLKNKGQVLSRDIILDRVWGYESDVSIKTIDATVKLLRKKLDHFGKQELIQSIRGVGYKID